MQNFVYNSMSNYFSTLSKTGYVKNSTVESLLVLLFYYHLLYDDYRGYVSQKDYTIIERALNCLYGTNCLIPYPDYLKMGKLKLGEMTEVLARTKAVEEYSEVLNKRINDNDALIEDNTMRIDEHGTRLDDHDSHLSTHDRQIANNQEHLELHDRQIANHEDRVSAIENTKVAKGKELISTIPDIVFPE